MGQGDADLMVYIHLGNTSWVCTYCAHVGGLLMLSPEAF